MTVNAYGQSTDCHTGSDSLIMNFKSERTIKTASITLNGNIKNVFPLFSPELEKKWAPEWEYDPIYIDRQRPSEHDVFSKPSHVMGEGTVIWIISRLDSVNYIIEYTLVSDLRIGIIHIECKKLSKDKTTATVTYNFTGLSPEGNRLCTHLLEKIYSKNLKDWEDAINDYLH